MALAEVIHALLSMNQTDCCLSFFKFTVHVALYHCRITFINSLHLSCCNFLMLYIISLLVLAF